VESIGIKKTFEKTSQAQVVMYLLDASLVNIANAASINTEIQRIQKRYPDKPLIVIANKIDKAKTDLINEQFNYKNLLLLSAKENIGVEDLKSKLLEFVNTGALRNNETIITNSRHYDALLKALAEIQKVQQGINDNLSGDLLAIDIRQALYHFGEITGEITSDDLLGNIFANFCIGK